MDTIFPVAFAVLAYTHRNSSGCLFRFFSKQGLIIISTLVMKIGFYSMYKLFVIVFLFSAVMLPERPVTIVSLRQYQNTAIRNNDTLYVVNFWATWCKPCVHEMPYFESANQKFRSENVKFIFVSMNAAKEVEQVKSFVNQNQVKADVLLLNAGNPNIWIDAVDSSWSGAIPATIMYRHGKKTLFYEGEFTQTQLDSVIQKQIF